MTDEKVRELLTEIYWYLDSAYTSGVGEKDSLAYILFCRVADALDESERS